MSPSLRLRSSDVFQFVRYASYSVYHKNDSQAPQQLLRGMLAADLIGFQTANYARHFRQTVSRILSAEALPKGIQLDNRFVDVGVFPMGIDVISLTQKRCVTASLSFPS